MEQSDGSRLTEFESGASPSKQILNFLNFRETSILNVKVGPFYIEKSTCFIYLFCDGAAVNKQYQSNHERFSNELKISRKNYLEHFP